MYPGGYFWIYFFGSAADNMEIEHQKGVAFMLTGRDVVIFLIMIIGIAIITLGFLAAAAAALPGLEDHVIVFVIVALLLFVLYFTGLFGLFKFIEHLLIITG